MNEFLKKFSEKLKKWRDVAKKMWYNRKYLERSHLWQQKRKKFMTLSL